MTPLEKRLVEEYPIDMNITQAGIRAGYSEKTAYSSAQRAMKKPEVAAAIAEALKARAARAEITQDMVLQELRLIGFAEMSANAADRASPALSWTDKRQALVDIGKHLGMFKERGGSDDPINIVVSTGINRDDD